MSIVVSLPIYTKCLTCKRSVLPHAKQIRCVTCLVLCHVKCLSLNLEERICILSRSSSWCWCYCIGGALPFDNIIADEEFKDALYCKDHFNKCWYRLNYELFEPLDRKEFDLNFPPDEVGANPIFYHNIWPLILTISMKKTSMIKPSCKDHY